MSLREDSASRFAGEMRNNGGDGDVEAVESVVTMNQDAQDKLEPKATLHLNVVAAAEKPKDNALTRNTPATGPQGIDLAPRKRINSFEKGRVQLSPQQVALREVFYANLITATLYIAHMVKEIYFGATLWLLALYFVQFLISGGLFRWSRGGIESGTLRHALVMSLFTSICIGIQMVMLMVYCIVAALIAMESSRLITFCVIEVFLIYSYIRVAFYAKRIKITISSETLPQKATKVSETTVHIPNAPM